MDPFIVNVVELLRRPGNRKPVRFSAPLAGIGLIDVRVPDDTDIDVDLLVESMADGLTVVGTVAARWEAECRRCLAPAGELLSVDVRELFQVVPTSDDAYAYDGERLDLERVVRDALLLDLPLAPLCRPDCAGLCPECGANRNEGDCGHDTRPVDARWSALDQLEWGN